MLRRLPACVAILPLLAVPAAAQSDAIQPDRPGLADSSTVVGRGTLQIETGLQWEKRVSEFSTFFPTLFRVGVTKRLEARVEGDTYTTIADHDLHESGLTPISLGFKALLTSPDGDGPSAGVIAGFTPAWGTGAFAAENASADVRLVVDLDLSDHWSLNPNAGFAWTDGELGAFVPALLAVTLAYQSRPGVEWFVDAAAEIPEAEQGTASVVIDAGVAYIPRRNLQLDFSAGSRAHGDTGPNPFISVGVSYRHKR
jgi:hypothetical protein